MTYEDHPQSLTERRARKEEDAAKWTPRDALIHTLRRIDSGEFKPDALVIMSRESDQPGSHLYSYTIASPDTTVTVGLVARVTHILHMGLGS